MTFAKSILGISFSSLVTQTSPLHQKVGQKQSHDSHSEKSKETAWMEQDDPKGKRLIKITSSISTFGPGQVYKDQQESLTHPALGKHLGPSYKHLQQRFMSVFLSPLCIYYLTPALEIFLKTY